MLEAHRAMTKDVITALPETPVIDIAKLLVQYRISGLPVVDAEKNLVGIISEKDLLQLLMNAESAQKQVRDLMTADVISFKDTDSLVTICEFLMTHNVRRVPIVRNGKLVGVVSRRDIIHEILKIRGQVKEG